MIKLTDIKERVFAIELPDGTVKKWDVIDLAKKLVPFMDSTNEQNIDQTEELRKIWDIPNLPGSVVAGLLAEFMICYTDEMGDIEDNVKKKVGVRLQKLPDSTIQGSTMPSDSLPTNE